MPSFIYLTLSSAVEHEYKVMDAGPNRYLVRHISDKWDVPDWNLLAEPLSDYVQRKVVPSDACPNPQAHYFDCVIRDEGSLELMERQLQDEAAYYSSYIYVIHRPDLFDPETVSAVSNRAGETKVRWSLPSLPDCNPKERLTYTLGALSMLRWVRGRPLDVIDIDVDLPVPRDFAMQELEYESRSDSCTGEIGED